MSICLPHRGCRVSRSSLGWLCGAHSPGEHKRTRRQEGKERAEEGKGRQGLCFLRAEAGPVLLQGVLGLLSLSESNKPMLRPQCGSVSWVPGGLAQRHHHQI